MAILKTGLDHYILAHEKEESVAAYGEPALLVEPSSGDLLYAHLDIPADDGSVRGANGLEVAIYRLNAPTPDQIEETTLEDAGPDGFDFEQAEDYESPFAEDGDEDGDEEGEEITLVSYDEDDPDAT